MTFTSNVIKDSSLPDEVIDFHYSVVSPYALTYSNVHIQYTLPIVVILYFIVRPLIDNNDKASLVFIMTCSLLYILPWNTYIISQGAWSHNHERNIAVPALRIPLEEYIFFIIQTITTVLFIQLMTRWDLHILNLRTVECSSTFSNFAGGGTKTAIKLSPSSSSSLPWSLSTPSPLSQTSWLIQISPIAVALTLTAWGWSAATPNTPFFCLSNIMWWTMPMLALELAIAGPYIWRNRRKAAISIIVSTASICWIAHHAHTKDVWTLNPSNTTGWMFTSKMSVEEAFFFFATRCLIVFGILTIQRICAIVRLKNVVQRMNNWKPFPAPLHQPTTLETLHFFTSAIMTRDAAVSQAILDDMDTALRLFSKGEVTYSAGSGLLPQSEREFFTVFAAFGRMMDDTVDEPTLPVLDCIQYITLCRKFIDDAYAFGPLGIDWAALIASSTFTVDQLAVLRIFSLYFPHMAPKYVFQDVLDAFMWDLKGARMYTVPELIRYCDMIGGSVSETMFSITKRCEEPQWDPTTEEAVKAVRSIRDMGLACQLINAARDVVSDAEKRQRMYAPDEWVKEVTGRYNDQTELSESEILALRAKHISDPWADEPGLRMYAENFLEAAEPFITSGSASIKLCPPSFRGCMKIVMAIYFGSADKIRTSPTYPKRAKRSKWWKLRVLMKTLYWN
jgi:lycopene cyclase domain-containing protein